MFIMINLNLKKNVRICNTSILIIYFDRYIVLQIKAIS